MFWEVVGFLRAIILIMPCSIDFMGDCPEWRFLKGIMRRNLPSRQEGAYELEYNALACRKKRTITAFRSNFVNRSMKPTIIMKKTDIRLKAPPFVTVPS